MTAEISRERMLEWLNYQLKTFYDTPQNKTHAESGVVLMAIRAELSGAYLRDADLSGAYLRGVPVIENIHQAVYAAASKEGALDMSTWHTCGTTHCRAGWVVTLAGAGGAALEWAMGTPAAAAMIYLASDPKLEKIPNFYACNADALADMKRLAELSVTEGEKL